MDEEKKSEASREEPERLGPYLIQEQVQQSGDSQGLYLATNETSGATALVREHACEEDAAARKDWRVRLGSWASRGYSAMEVEHTGWARAQDRQSAESLLLTLEGVLEEVRRMVRALSGTQEPRHRWRLGWGVASAATVGALLLALVGLLSMSQPPGAPEPLASAPPALMSHEEPTAGETDMPTHGGLVDTADAGQAVLARLQREAAALVARTVRSRGRCQRTRSGTSSPTNRLTPFLGYGLPTGSLASDQATQGATD